MWTTIIFSSTLLCRLEVGWKLQLGRRECCFHASEALEYSAEQCKNKLEQIYALLSKIAKTCSRFDEHLSRHCKYIPKKLGLTDREGQAGCRISTFLKSHFHFWTLNHLLCACARIPVQAVFPLWSSFQLECFRIPELCCLHFKWCQAPCGTRGYLYQISLLKVPVQVSDAWRGICNWEASFGG